MITITNIDEDYSEQYTEDSFWRKVLKYGKKAGVKVTYAALLLFYTAQKPTIPLKAKGTIFGALGYFISPIDFIPDITPGVGYADDLIVLITALLIVAAYIDTETKQLAKNKIVDWFGKNALKAVESIDKDIEKKRHKNEDNDE
ncbi:YkvA family protein [Sporosarcina sp. CAU 1771]